MATYTSTITPRLRVTRRSPIASDSSTSRLASDPSHLPDFSQLVDVNLNDMPTSETTEQQSAASRPSTPSTVTRSENPAAVLRALLSRLPPSSPPPQKRSPSSRDPSERESDHDGSESSHAAPSVAQESLRDLFSKARRDSGGTTQKTRHRRNSLDNSEVDASPANARITADKKGKQRSMSDDEVDQFNHSSPKKPSNRSRATPQPVTMEFLRERFDNSLSSQARPRSSSSNRELSPSPYFLI
ncbi:hypothetical protein CPB84DRAFT_668190 [Gymnopilus junonius]|uniref:Uncharacterized protein n=1 Tax=Gymnopilus junonius TaxID=109634 RepID=A0A9P5TQT8_GYMJU|nr:hypothetical protein CPB84DRAFT_668190 [Gymnopilus junonius]